MNLLNIYSEQAFHYVNLSNICSEQAVPFHNPSNVRFFIVVKGQIDWLKYFCVVMKTSRILNRKKKKIQTELVFSSETDQQKTTSKREESEEKKYEEQTSFCTNVHFILIKKIRRTDFFLLQPSIGPVQLFYCEKRPPKLCIKIHLAPL